MLQVASGSDRNIWAHELGWLIISMNEIDWLISTAYSTLFGGVWDEKWLAKTAAERRDILLGEMSKAPKSPALERLVRLIDRVGPLMETRNHIAHGELGVVGAPVSAPQGSGFVMFRYHKKSKQFCEISLVELREEVAEAKALSNDFSEFAALCKMNADFVQPYQTDTKGSES